MSFAPAAWSSLPAELFGLIFAGLPLRDLLTAAVVCRAWRRAATADELWAPYLVGRLNTWPSPSNRPSSVVSTAEELLAMRKAGLLSALSFRDQYTLWLAIGRSTRVLERTVSNGTRQTIRSPLEYIRGATQYGFDPIRHLAPSWANVLRLVRLWVVHGSQAVAAVGDTCALHGATRYHVEEWPVWSSSRGRAFLSLFVWSLSLILLALVAISALLYLLCDALAPHFARAAALFLAMPVVLVLIINVLDVTDPKGDRIPRIVVQWLLLVVPHVVHAYVLHRFGLGVPWSLPFIVGRLCLGGVMGVAMVPRPDLLVAALFGLGDYLAPILLVSSVFYFLPLRKAQRLFKAVLERRSARADA